MLFCIFNCNPISLSLYFINIAISVITERHQLDEIKAWRFW